MAQSAEIWDVAVIGAGPAGTMAALAAASRNQRVVILERFRIPRYKTCAGGLIGASMNMIPEGVTPHVRATATSLTFWMRGRSERTKTSGVPLVNLVQRAEFDAMLLGAATGAGRSAAYVGVVFDQVDLGLELELVTPSDQSGDWADRILIDWGTVPGAYGWVFPKGDTLSVGAGGKDS